MAILTAVDGRPRRPTGRARPVGADADLVTRYDVDHVVLHVTLQDVFEAFRAEADGATGTPPGPSGATYDRRSGREERRTEPYSVEAGERHGRGVVRVVVRDHLDVDDRDVVVRQGRPNDPVAGSVSPNGMI